jgi:hypothetical protein
LLIDHKGENEQTNKKKNKQTKQISSYLEIFTDRGEITRKETNVQAKQKTNTNILLPLKFLQKVANEK